MINWIKLSSTYRTQIKQKTRFTTNHSSYPCPSPVKLLGANDLLLQILHNSGFILISQASTPTNLTVLPSLRDLPFFDAGLESAAAHVEFLGRTGGRNIKVEDIHGET